MIKLFISESMQGCIDEANKYSEDNGMEIVQVVELRTVSDWNYRNYWQIVVLYKRVKIE